MPEFHLNTEGASPAQFATLDSFTQGFIEAAFFCESSCYAAAEFFTPDAQARITEGQADGIVPSDSGPAEIDDESLIRITSFCAEFQRANAALLNEAYGRDYDDTQAGRDLYFTRAGHGVGYWDRDALAANDSDSAEYERLTDIMVAAGHDSTAWDTALRERNAIESRSIGQRLTRAAGRGSIDLCAYESAASLSGFFVEFHIS